MIDLGIVRNLQIYGHWLIIINQDSNLIKWHVHSLEMFSKSGKHLFPENNF